MKQLCFLILLAAGCAKGPAAPLAQKLIDLNGDGKPDRVSMDAANRIWVEIARGEGFAAPRVWWEPLPSQRILEQQFWLADVTGDGRPDLILRSLQSELLVAEAKPDQFLPSEVWLKDLPKLPAEGVVFEDFNHDGKMDLILKLDGGDDEYLTSARRFEHHEERRRR